MASQVPKYRLGPILGSGAYSLVFRGIREPSGAVVALKKSRVSLRVRRTILWHEARVLQLLQGHPAFPRMVGYSRAPHFEYLAMEMLGKSVKEKAGEGKTLRVKTVVRIGEQMLSALEHMHAQGLVHRDIKPQNILLCPLDPSRNRLIDFGISRPFQRSASLDCVPAPRYDPEKDGRHIVGTLHWCSLNAHQGVDLGPRDDLESLAYVLLSLVRGSLPWHGQFGEESTRHAMSRIYASKLASSGPSLTVTGVPVEFGDLLDYAKMLGYGGIPDYDMLSSRWRRLADRVGCLEGEPLDWTAHDPLKDLADTPPVEDVVDHSSNTSSSSSEDEEDDDDEQNEEYSNSYYALDIADWDIQGGRDKSLTLPTQEGLLLDGAIPEIQVLEKA